MHTINISNSATKNEKYESLLPQIKSLLENETDMIANMANVSAALKEAFNFLWVGFYIVKKNNEQEEELVLGPFQGPIACTRIAKGRGVCGTAWATGKTQIVPDVELFPGHIACSSKSRSEIVIPFSGKEISGVFDIDSEYLNTFDEIDSKYLDIILSYLNL
jgi:GAF domain-containing protein